MPDNIRIGDVERDEAVRLLQEHHAAGRLSTEEFDDRMGRALQAKVSTDLVMLFGDLPGRKPGQSQSSAQQPFTAPPQYGVPALYGTAAPVPPVPAAKLPKPWFAQWWMLLGALVISGVTDGRLGILVPLMALWIWVIYPQMARKNQAVAAAPTRPLTYEERDQIMGYVRTGHKVQGIKRYRELTGADLYTARMTVEAMARELGR